MKFALGFVAGTLALACNAPAEGIAELSAGDDRESRDAGSEGDNDAGSGDAGVDCGEGVSTRTARAARSGGFAGSEEDYFALYDVSCETTRDCEEACVAAGGLEEMCADSQCLEEFEAGRSCLPPTIWRNFDNILFEGTSPADAVEITQVYGDYHDPLLTGEFKHEVPRGARIHGIAVEIRRTGSNRTADHSVTIIKDGTVGDAERARPEVWTPEFEWIEYGGPTDLWGETWTPSDVNADDFGVAIALTYTRESGNTRAYVDQVRSTIHFERECD